MGRFKEMQIQKQESKALADKVIEVNEYIEKWSEIQPHLDEICENIFNKRVFIVNDGCDEYLVRKIVGYLENHDIVVGWADKEEC